MIRVVARSIWVRFQKEGIHNFPEALTRPELAEVAFLGHPHRHIFHFEVEIPVYHDNREVEFIMFKRDLEKLYDDATLILNNRSCEMLAETLARHVINTYGVDWCQVLVSEDNENGAAVLCEKE